MQGQLAFTQLLNDAFAGPVDALLQVVGIHPHHPNAPINNTFSLELLVVLGFIAFFVLVRVSLSVEKPGAPQQFAELINEFIGGQAEQVIGHGYQRFQAFVTCIFLFVLVCNLVGLIPGLESPTQSVVVPFGLAVATFVYYNFHGIREQGLIGYLKHFAGPVWWIAWLLFPIEVISHVARMMSLTIRLWANMFAGDLVTLVFFSLIPVGIPVIFLGMHLGVSIVQAFVFMLLSMIYLGQAVAHDH
ncbi:MAG: F0F1 ATP synthase subunit A [Terracidiphilus sp.]|jgi:F-type H+-transporting ATPase subunit a